MLERMSFCSNLIDTAIESLDKADLNAVSANLHGLKNVINSLKFGDDSASKAVLKIAKATGIEDVKVLENLILMGCNIAARGHGSSQLTYASLIEREAELARLVTLPMIGVKAHA